MKITFPHMGKAHIPIRALLQEFDVDHIVPPKCTKKTLEIGTRYSPESICLPMKVNIGNYIQSIERGADTILLTGSCGPCRFGYYSVVEKEILKDLGYDIDFVVFEAPEGDIPEFLNRINKVFGTKNPVRLFSALHNAIKTATLVDEIDQIRLNTYPIVKNLDKLKAIDTKYEKMLSKTYGLKKAQDVLREHKKELKSLEVYQDIKPIKIAIVGEIYTLIEPFVNINIEEKLMKMGVVVERSLTISSWIRNALYYRTFGLTNEKEIIEAGKPFLPTMIGGHGRETIGFSSKFGDDQDCDGIIQILPFGCMPEIVAEAILPTVSKQKNTPIMTLVVDELTGEAGYATRLEAFVDLIELRKGKKNYENNRVLFGN